MVRRHSRLRVGQVSALRYALTSSSPGAVRQRSLKKLRAKNYDGTDDDWSSTVLSVLDPTTTSPAASQEKDNLDVTCSLSGKGPNRTLSIAFSNKVEDITQRLGTIELSETEDTDDVDLFGWASHATEQRDNAQVEVVNLRAQTKTKDDIVASLQKQIDELVEAKIEHEKQMLSKFTLLLNEKKLKIRNMQRILATANLDREKLKELEDTIGHKPATLATKNKRRVTDEAQDDDQDDSEDFETMDVDPTTNDQKEPDSPESGGTTPSASEAQDEDVEDFNEPATYSNQPRKGGGAPTGRGESEKRSEASMPERSQSANTTKENDDDDAETASEASDLEL